MNRARWKEIDDQFRQALDLPEADRARYVLELLVRNPELGCAVKDLLESAAEAEAVLGESAAVFAGPMLAGLSSQEWESLHPGAIVGAYRLLREIGRSGRSTVYLAEPANAKFGTRVAIKVMTRGADAGDIIGRITHEREALASLEHAGIARFHDGGATAGGLPFLIFELVDGRPLLAWCDERRLDVPARLRLFLQICAAVQHAHQHFVAHSDLTASRILVSEPGTTKIMEFGTARLLQPGLVSTADDVHSLGVILHQLLTGRTPPASNGTRASDVARAGGDAVSRARRTSPAGLAARLRGDLDAIAARALERDPSHLYQSAAALADDIMRHLEHRPVHARPASAGYRAGRFMQRHRARLGVATLAGLAIVAVAATAGFQLSRRAGATPAVQVETLPMAAAPATPMAQQPARGAPPTPEIAAPAVQATAETAQPPAAVPVVAKPVVARPANPVNEEPQPRATARPRRSPADSAALLGALASSLRQAGRTADAEAALRQALALGMMEGGESLPVAEQQWELGDLLRVTQQYPEAEVLLRSSLLIRKRLASSEGAEVGQSLAGLAMVQCEMGRKNESDSLFKQAIRIYQRLPADAGGLRMPETDRAQCR
jgi:serine/threonine-protein kinase